LNASFEKAIIQRHNSISYTKTDDHTIASAAAGAIQSPDRGVQWHIG
jgi:hypothetical protein